MESDPAMKRDIFGDEDEQLRETLRQFIDRELAPRAPSGGANNAASTVGPSSQPPSTARPGSICPKNKAAGGPMTSVSERSSTRRSQAPVDRPRHCRCKRRVQLPGGYGYMMEYGVARDYADSRIQTISGGTTEIMKDLIGRFRGL